MRYGEVAVTGCSWTFEIVKTTRNENPQRVQRFHTRENLYAIRSLKLSTKRFIT
jgi:hypothetical protein